MKRVIPFRWRLRIHTEWFHARQWFKRVVLRRDVLTRREFYELARQVRTRLDRELFFGPDA